MEFRSGITVHGLSIESEEADELLTVLERDAGEFGPVLASAEEGTQVVLATDARDRRSAGEELLGVVHRALDGIDQGDRLVTLDELGPAD